MTLEEKIKNLPENSGVYIMHDKAGNIIYVGKAVVLKNRVRQYFNHSPKPAKVQAMVDNIADFEYMITLTEKDALALEANLIRKYKPHYNILLKDDKHSPYIKIDMREDYPAIEVTRKVRRDGARAISSALSAAHTECELARKKCAKRIGRALIIISACALRRVWATSRKKSTARSLCGS